MPVSRSAQQGLGFFNRFRKRTEQPSNIGGAQMSTTPTPTPVINPTATWINLLISLGVSLGSSFATPVIQNILGASATAAENLVTILANRKSGTAESTVVPIFLTVLQAAITVLQTEGKLTPEQSATLNKALTDTFAADAAAQQTVDPTTLKPIAPL